MDLNHLITAIRNHDWNLWIGRAMLRPMLQALIFDVDGTLADTERDGHRLAFNAAFKEAGLPWHWDVALYGRTAGGHGRQGAHAALRARPRAGAGGQAGFEALMRKLHVLKTEHYVQLVHAGHDSLAPRGRAAVARGARRRPAPGDRHHDLAGKRLGAAARQPGAGRGILVRGDRRRRRGAAKKPAPDIYLWVLERLGLPAEACLAFEDSGNGLKAALGAGLATVVTDGEYTRDHDFSGAIAVLSDLGVPDRPASVRRGDMRGQGCCVDVDLLRLWHREIISKK
jgi:beta-phosphoglucomutase-like phosphatase (HAD superfamily)